MIAMSIACEPLLLIADEPTTALDVTVQAQILKLLDELKTRMNMGMLFITHDFGAVSYTHLDVYKRQVYILSNWLRASVHFL